MGGTLLTTLRCREERYLILLSASVSDNSGNSPQMQHHLVNNIRPTSSYVLSLFLELFLQNFTIFYHF